MKRVVILGAGFGGLKLARALSNNLHYEVYLLDKANHHQFQPLFYQVATAGIDASNISFPLRKVFQDVKNVHIRLCEVQTIDTIKQLVHTDDDQPIKYDILVVATGAGTNFFGNEMMEQHALGMKSTLDAINIRNQLLQNFENATNANTDEEQQAFLNVCIVGGGPTGVELSGAIAEMKKYILPKDFPELDFKKMNIYIFEGSATTLENMNTPSSERSMRYLKNLGVTLKMNTKVSEFDGDVLKTLSGDVIPTKNVIWAAGIKGNVPGGLKQELVTRGNRILVDEYCRVQGFNNIYAIGDVACMVNEDLPRGHPQVAPVAVQQANMVARNLKESTKKHYTWEAFEYFDKGSMATVGRNLAVVDMPFGKISLGGFIAWLIWMFLHLFLILGVKNKLFIFINWFYNYFTYDQSLRLLFPKKKP
jgi:NADH:ubiquinone reductase (H+-translocating)